MVNSTLAGQIASRQILRYASYAYDAESGLYYLSARSYDPLTRQFISKDPAKADGEESAYQYCGGEPVTFIDPTGESWYNPFSWRWVKKIPPEVKWSVWPYRFYKLVKEVQTFCTIERDVYRTSAAENARKARYEFEKRKSRDPQAVYEEIFGYNGDSYLRPDGTSKLASLSTSRIIGWAQVFSSEYKRWHASRNYIVAHKVYHKKVVSFWKSVTIYISLW